MHKSQREMIKDWLEAYRNDEAEIDESLEKLRMLRAHMMSVGAQELSDMPRPPSISGDRMTEYVIRVEALEAKIDQKFLEHDRDRMAIADLLKKIEPEERYVIWNRYLFGMEWRDVLNRVYQKQTDFEDKIETYRRRMYRAHEKALDDMAKFWQREIPTR